MTHSRRSVLCLIGKISLITLGSSAAMSTLLLEPSSWEEARQVFLKHCPADLFIFDNPGRWKAISPYRQSQVYRVRMSHLSPSDMSALTFYKYLNSVMDWTASDRDLESRLRSGQIISVHYNYSANIGTWVYGFKNEQAYQDFLSFSHSPLQFKIQEVGWIS